MDQPGKLKKTLQPREAFLFYVSMIFYQAGGTTRTAFISDGQDLFYKIKVLPDITESVIPCGQLVFGG